MIKARWRVFHPSLVTAYGSEADEPCLLFPPPKSKKDKLQKAPVWSSYPLIPRRDRQILRQHRGRRHAALHHIPEPNYKSGVGSRESNGEAGELQTMDPPPPPARSLLPQRCSRDKRPAMICSTTTQTYFHQACLLIFRIKATLSQHFHLSAVLSLVLSEPTSQLSNGLLGL
ncbi:uncharacterized protein AB9W97_011288 [Spinachia spinachia]